MCEGISGIIKERMIQTSKTQSPYRRMLLFSEVCSFGICLLNVSSQGTTTNGDYLLKFKRGAFLAGLPVQPVVLIYSSHWISPAWETITGARHVYLMLCFPYATVPICSARAFLPWSENTGQVFAIASLFAVTGREGES